MDEKAVKLSVVIPIYNQGKYLFEAAASVLADRPDAEVIVVDDGSTEDLWDLLGDLNAKYFRLGKRQGVAAARNFGAKQARGEYLCFLDADDRLATHGLTWRVRYLEEHPEAQAVAGCIGNVLDENGALPAGFTFPWLAHTWPAVLTEQWARETGPVQTAAWSLAFRRSFFWELGGFNEALRFDPDSDLLMRALEREPIPYVSRATVDYRVHSDNHTRLGDGAFRQKPEVVAETWLSYLAAVARHAARA